MVDLVIVGSAALDSVKTPFGEAQNALGGSAVFSSCAASYFTKPGIVAVVGDDFPKQNIELLKAKGIDLEGLKTEGKTFRWSGSYEYAMNDAKTHKTELNSFETFKPKLPESYRNAKYVFLANINPELQLEVLKQVKNPKLVMLDSMNLWINIKKEKLLEVIKKVDILLLNESEARQLFETPNLVKSAAKVLSMGPKYFIVKKGEHGALLFSEGNYFNAPGYPLEVIKDPTGCGDCFAGGLIGYIAKQDEVNEKTLRKAVIYGSVIASFNAEDFSLNRLKTVTMKDIESRYKEFQKMREF